MSAGKSTVHPLITAEHASKAVPVPYSALFRGQHDLLDSHHGWDAGTRLLAQQLAETLHAPLLEGQVTRLLVDLNRSEHHRARLSRFSRSLTPVQQQALIARYWQPHWQAFSTIIEDLPGRVCHIACHSFTPVLDGVVRNADIGLLYDPSRQPEKAWCQVLKDCLAKRLPELKVRMNYPYRGTSNGLGQQHRKRFGPDKLLTMELEVNTRLVERSDWPRIRAGLVDACRESCSR
jgi:predicted N-formylglutamate amidohydrolase